MNKSKFKSVNWKHGNTEMHSLMENDCKYYWQSDLFPFAGKHGFVKVPEDFIEQYPELFEVEKAGREFEEGAYYKVRFQGCLNYEVALCRINKANGLFTFTIPDYLAQYKEAFQEIGEKIELKNEL